MLSFIRDDIGQGFGAYKESRELWQLWTTWRQPEGSLALFDHHHLVEKPYFWHEKHGDTDKKIDNASGKSTRLLNEKHRRLGCVRNPCTYCIPILGLLQLYNNNGYRYSFLRGTAPSERNHRKYTNFENDTFLNMILLTIVDIRWNLHNETEVTSVGQYWRKRKFLKTT